MTNSIPCHPDCGLCKAGTNPRAEMYPELSVPPACSRWPTCDPVIGEKSCTWPACADEG